jgi:hypothetical protein
MAVAAKAKGPASDSIMTPDKMKALLALSKHEPLHAAIALTNDGDGLILLDKKAKPKKVMSMLRADAAKAKIALNNATVRFGRAEVDTEYDSGMVRFFINKDAPGNMRVKLVEVVKRIPYQKVEINVDPSFEAEPEEDEAETETEDGQAGAESVAAPAAEAVPAAPVVPPQASTPPDAAALAHELGLLMRRIPEATATDAALKATVIKLATDGNTAVKANNLEVAQGLITQLREQLDGAAAGSAAAPPVPPPAPRPPGAPPANAATLGHELALLIKRIGEVSSVDPGLRGNLAKMAGDANTALKENDLAAAGTAIAQLRDALDRAAAAGGPDAETPDEAAAAAWQAARKAWQDANDAVNDQINGLRTALLEAAKEGDGDTEGLALALTDLAENGLNEITEDHRVRLMAAVQELAGGTPAAMRKSGARALALIEGFESFLGSNPKIAACDDNPYGAPVSIRATLTPPLRQMAAALRAATAS